VIDNVELFNPSARYQEGCFIYHNLGNGKFENWSEIVGPDIQTIGANRGIAVGDFDNDGSLEIAVNRLNDTTLFFKRRGSGDNHWILLNLRGTKSNRDAIGAKIQLTLPSGLKQYDHVTTANGIYSASDKRVHFGLGAESQIKSLQVRWPSGIVQTLQGIKADQVLTITEPEK
jgi:hypothetical protein